MSNQSQMGTVRRMTESALMIALATVLAAFPIFELPMGGSVTLCCELPIIIIAYRYGCKWGVFMGLVFGLIQMLFGLSNFSYVKGIGAYLIVALFDYVIAFGVLGLGGMFKNKIKNQGLAVSVGAVVVCLLRFICHFISGTTVWADYADGWKSVWQYSLTYNGSYMILEAIFCAVAGYLICLALDFSSPNLRKKKKAQETNV